MLRLSAVVWLLAIIIADVLCADSKASVHLRIQADALVKKGKFQEAIQMYGDAIKQDPKDHMNFYKRALIHQAMGRHMTALLDLNSALDLTDTFSKAFSQRGDILLSIGEFEEARDDFVQYTKMEPSDPKGHEHLAAVDRCKAEYDAAKAHVEHNSIEQALEHYKAVVECAPKWAELRMERAHLLVQRGEIHEAIGDAGRAAKLQTKSLEPVLLLATLHYQIGEADNALTHLRACLVSDENHKGCKALYTKVKNFNKFMTKGDEAFKTGRMQEALESYQRCAELEQSVGFYYVRVHTKLCHTHVKLKQGKEALHECNAALSVDGQFLDALLRSGEAHLLLEEYDEAVRAYQNAKQIYPQNHEANQGHENAQRQLKMSKRKDYYKILGVSKTAGTREISKAYRKLALEWHPDKHPPEGKEQAAKMFHDLGEAKDVLSDEEKRRRYDNGEDVEVPQQQQQGFWQQGGQQFHFRWGG